MRKIIKIFIIGLTILLINTASFADVVGPGDFYIESETKILPFIVIGIVIVISVISIIVILNYKKITNDKNKQESENK